MKVYSIPMYMYGQALKDPITKDKTVKVMSNKYSQTSSIQSPKGQSEVFILERCPYWSQVTMMMSLLSLLTDGTYRKLSTPGPQNVCDKEVTFV